MIPKISIIIPVYNSEKYLNQCIDSVLGQSFSDFELLLVNDGSTDDSGLICDDYAKRDKRIKVFHQENKGQGAARNLGLKHSTGEYILFVDSDDAIATDTIFENIRLLNSNPEIECLQYPVYMSYGTDKAYIKKNNEDFYTNKESFKNLILAENIISWLIWDKIYKKELFDNLQFREDIKYEDNFLMMKLIQKLNNIYISEKGMYYYYRRENSTTTSKLTLLKEKSTIEVLSEILKMINPINEKKLFYKFLIRYINVSKTLKVVYNFEVENYKQYKKHIHIIDIFKERMSLKNTLKVLFYKM